LNTKPSIARDAELNWRLRMLLTEAIAQCRETKRSRLYLFAGKARELTIELEWLKGRVGDKTMLEILEGREICQ